MWPNFAPDGVIEIMISAAILLALPVFPAVLPFVLLQEPSLRWGLEEIRTHEGSLNDNALGFYVNNCGDLNGDGVGEYLIGSPGDAKDGKQVGGVQVRSGKDWAAWLEQAIELFGDDLELVFGSHHWPRWGREEAVEYLANQRDLYGYVHDQTLRLANQGREAVGGGGDRGAVGCGGDREAVGRPRSGMERCSRRTLYPRPMARVVFINYN
jgi:hypothetical protein